MGGTVCVLILKEIEANWARDRRSTAGLGFQGPIFPVFGRFPGRLGRFSGRFFARGLETVLFFQLLPGIFLKILLA